MLRLWLVLTCATTLLPARAATIVASDNTETAVETAVASAVDGDTVVIPAVTNSWVRTVTITKRITISGAGYWEALRSGTDFVVDANNKPILTNHNATATVIIDEHTSRNALIMLVQTNAAGIARISGIEFRRGTITGNNNRGVVQVKGINGQITGNAKTRVDHCYFNQLIGRPIGMYGFAGHLADHNYFDHAGSSANVVYGGVENGGDNGWLSWSTDVPYGTIDEGNCWEDNAFVSLNNNAAMDHYRGARNILRFCIWWNADCASHGTDSSNIGRGVRHQAIYGHTAFTQHGDWFAAIRGGTAIVCSNTLTGFDALMRLYDERLYRPSTPWGMAIGTSPWDDNDTTIYETFTHTGPTVTNDAGPVSDSSKNWTNDMWVSYAAVDLSVSNTIYGLVMYNQGSRIESNDESELELKTSTTSFVPTYTTGDLFAIRRVRRVLDGVGMGKGDVVTYNGTSTQPTPTTWPNQIYDPVSHWSNTLSNVFAGDSVAVEGLHYTNATKSGYVFLQYPHPNIALSEGSGGGVAPTIVTHPQSQTITTGSTATMSVAATGTAPLSYQWYTGASGSTVSPISGATSASYTTPALSSTTSYWVRVTNGSGSDDSDTATITVESVVIDGTVRLLIDVQLRVGRLRKP